MEGDEDEVEKTIERHESSCPLSPASDVATQPDGIDQLRRQVAHLERLLREERSKGGAAATRRCPSDDGDDAGNNGLASGGSGTSSGFEFVEKSFSGQGGASLASGGASTASSTSDGDDAAMKGVQLIGGFEDDNLYGVEAEGKEGAGDAETGEEEGSGEGGGRGLPSTDEEVSGEGEKDLVEIWESQVTISLIPFCLDFLLYFLLSLNFL